MTRRSLPFLALIAVLALPSVAAAACAGHEEAKMSCGEGTSWNPETRACETQSS